MRAFCLIIFLGLSACTSAVAPPPDVEETPAPTPVSMPSPQEAADNFVAVVDLVEPIAERICRAELTGAACDFQIAVDSRTSMPPNAFQTLDRSGRPVIIFTVALIAQARNRDELAFILGHEAAHHIAGHMARQRELAAKGAILAGVQATLDGASPRQVRRAQVEGAAVGALAFSKEFELEADAMGTVIAYRAGFDPERGAGYFGRSIDPGNEFLGTHPPNAARIATVRRVMAGLR